jgi:nuclear pore complex protein Nup214
MSINLPTKYLWPVVNSLSQSLFQDLTYQLVELERHFNSLELNKFSQYDGHHIGRGASQNRYGPSRYD